MHQIFENVTTHGLLSTRTVSHIFLSCFLRLKDRSGAPCLPSVTIGKNVYSPAICRVVDGGHNHSSIALAASRLLFCLQSPTKQR